MTPSPADLLTCTTTQFVATVTNTTNQSVMWKVDPTPTGGSIAADGTYSAPKQVPAPATASVTATSVADTKASDVAAVTLATVHPTALQALSGLNTEPSDVYAHVVASKGQRSYASWVEPTSGFASVVQFTSSTDGGATWATLKNVHSSPAVDAMCSVVAVDPADDKIAYVVFRSSRYGCTPTTISTTSVGTSLILGVTKDGGATFDYRQLAATYNGYAICPDIVAPSANHVVISAPALDGSNIDVFTSATNGSDFALIGTCDGSDITAAEFTVAPGLATVSQDGGSAGVTESPRLFTDGAGKVCMTFAGGDFSIPDACVTCSPDNGATWSSSKKLSADTVEAHLPQGTFGKSGQIAVAWWNDDGTTRLATSPGIGQAFTAEQTLPTYTSPDGPTSSTAFGIAYEGDILYVATNAYGGGQVDRVVVDKSCDDGKTWSGIQLVNGPEGSVGDLTFPGLVQLGGKLSIVARRRDSGDDKFFTLGLLP